MGADAWNCVLSEHDVAIVIALFGVLADAGASICCHRILYSLHRCCRVNLSSYDVNTRQLHPALGTLRI